MNKATLQEFIPGHIWVCRIPLRFFGLQIGTRMTVIRLAGGKLFVHSPVGLTPALKKELDALGPVGVVVSPNKLHHLFISDYFDAYPAARIYASPGLPEKRKDLKFRYTLGDQPENEWAAEIDQIIFYGHPMLQEVVFFHRASRTLILADLIMNFDEESAPLTRLAMRVFGMYKKPTPPADFKATLTQKLQALLYVDRILQWDFEGIILAHGRLVQQEGRKVFKEAFSWLYE